MNSEPDSDVLTSSDTAQINKMPETVTPRQMRPAWFISVCWHRLAWTLSLLILDLVTCFLGSQRKPRLSTFYGILH